MVNVYIYIHTVYLYTHIEVLYIYIYCSLELEKEAIHPGSPCLAGDKKREADPHYVMLPLPLPLLYC